MILVKLFLLDIFLDIVEKSFHSLGKNEQIWSNKSIWSKSFFVKLKYFEASVMARSHKVSVFGQSDHPIPICLSLLHLLLCFCFIVPCSEGFILWIRNEGSRFIIENHARDVIFVSGYGWMLPSHLVCVLPEFDFAIIWTGNYQILGRVEADPIATSFVSV